MGQTMRFQLAASLRGIRRVGGDFDIFEPRGMYYSYDMSCIPGDRSFWACQGLFRSPNTSIISSYSIFVRRAAVRQG